MSINSLYRTTSALFAAVLCLLLASPSTAQTDAKSLYRVKKIYLQGIDDALKEREILKSELEAKGFEIVEASSDADAILTQRIFGKAQLDPDSFVPDKSIYSFQLTAPDKKLIWKANIEFPTKKNMKEDAKYAAAKMAEKLSKDWQKSAKKAGAK
ncbi:MAG: hypothetical protein JOZ52_14995 [Acidobacteria bacterium]|nr:hypothetical protein [Acidobacteriota bacterium]